MERAFSEPSLLQTRRHVVRDHIGGSIPGYQGHVPGLRTEEDVSFGTWAKAVDASRGRRSRSTYDAQGIRTDFLKEDKTSRSTAPTPKQPSYDQKGIAYPFAGDFMHSRIPAAGETKSHLHSSMGLTSLAHEGLGKHTGLRGYGSAPRGIPGFMGHVPGKNSENVYARTWSKTAEHSLARHLDARRSAAKEWCVITDGGTLVAPGPSDAVAEMPIRNPSYQDRTRGWSECEFTGKRIDPAGRLAPKDRQEGYGERHPPASKNQIHGYAGWVPGRVGENVVGERQCKTNDISDHLFKKSATRITQR